MAEQTEQELQKELGLEEMQEPAKASEQEKPKQTMVPHEALHEQRELNKQLREEVRRANERSERMEGTFQKLLSSLNEKPAPKFEDDPLGHMASRNEKLEAELRGVSEKLENITKQGGQAALLQEITVSMTSSEAEFRATHPDYDLALKHLREVSRQDLADQGFGQAEIDQALKAGKIGLAHAALQQGKDPAQIIYERAKRYGYKPSGKSEKIEDIAKGMDMAKTVSGGGGDAGLSLRELAEIPEQQLDAIISDEKKFQALIRGQIVR